MRFDNLTIKSREAIESMQHIYQSLHHAECTSLHLLKALLDQGQGSVVNSLLERIGIKPTQIGRAHV